MAGRRPFAGIEGDMTADRERWVLIFEPQPSNVPAVVRFRALLKRAIRDYGLKCVAARDHQPSDPKLGTYDVGNGRTPSTDANGVSPASEPTGCDRPAGAKPGAVEANAVQAEVPAAPARCEETAQVASTGRPAGATQAAGA